MSACQQQGGTGPDTSTWNIIQCSSYNEDVAARLLLLHSRTFVRSGARPSAPHGSHSAQACSLRASPQLLCTLNDVSDGQAA